MMHSRSCFNDVSSLIKKGVSTVPERFILPPMQRPDKDLVVQFELPVIDLSSLNHPTRRIQLIQDVGSACNKLGCFQVINHEIRPSVIKDALLVGAEFFDLPSKEKNVYASDNIREPVRYGTSLNQAVDRVHYWRDFIKHYSNPLSTWIHLWPSNPSMYKRKMGEYAMATHMLQKKLTEIVFESLGLNPNYLGEEIEEGTQLMTVNNYSAWPQPELVLGMPPHSDYGYLTVLIQNKLGLEVMNNKNIWLQVHCGEGSLIIMLGDQTEILSNGQYKSPIHRATVSSENNRISVASLHSLAMEKKVRPAAELVDGEHTLRYKEGSFGDFLDFITKNDITQHRYIDTLKKNC